MMSPPALLGRSVFAHDEAVSREYLPARPSADRRQLVLVISDPAHAQALRPLLAEIGIRSSWAATPEAARTACSHVHFDAVVISAVALKPALGQGVIALRSWYAGPLMVIDTAAGEQGEVLALEHGANAYVPMDASPRLLRARLLAQLDARPASPIAAHADALKLPGDWRFDTAASALRHGDRELPLTQLQLALLQCLASPFGRVVARAELEAKVGTKGEAVKRHTIEVYIFRLRQRPASFGLDSFQVEAVWRRGYRLRAAAPVPT